MAIEVEKCRHEEKARLAIKTPGGWGAGGL